MPAAGGLGKEMISTRLPIETVSEGRNGRARDMGAIIGVLAALFILAAAVLVGRRSLLAYWDLRSILIVLGGTFSTAFICYPAEQVLNVFRVLTKVFFHKSENPLDRITQFMHFADKARRDGILSLEQSLSSIDDDFMRSGVRLAVDGVDPEMIKEILETELAFIEERHQHSQSILLNMGTYAPAFGLIGTLIGLIMMLQSLSTPEHIGPALATALITTFYGVVLANVIFLPMANKLKVRSAEEIHLKELTIEGVLAIQSGDNPRIVERKLKAFLAPELRRATALSGRTES